MAMQIRVDLDVDGAVKKSGACDWAASFAMQLVEDDPQMGVDLGNMTDEAVLQVAHMLRELFENTPAQDAVVQNAFTANMQFSVPQVVGMLSQAYRPEVMKKVTTYVASN